MQEGWVNVVSRHTTTAVTLNECESRLMDDVRQFLLKLAPPSYPYLHNDIHLRPATEDVRACVRACRPAMRLLLSIDWVACVFSFSCSRYRRAPGSSHRDTQTHTLLFNPPMGNQPTTGQAPRGGLGPGRVARAGA